MTVIISYCVMAYEDVINVKLKRNFDSVIFHPDWTYLTIRHNVSGVNKSTHHSVKNPGCGVRPRSLCVSVATTMSS